MNGQTVALTAAEWQRSHDELLGLLTNESGGHPMKPGHDIRIVELRSTLARAVPSADDSAEPDRVGLGSLVTVRSDDGLEETFQVVAPDTVVLDDDTISYQAPVGQAVLGRRPGERVAVATPVGPTPLEIVAVEGSAGPTRGGGLAVAAR